MIAAVLIVILLALAASLASWLFGQWLGTRSRISNTALAVGGGAAVLLIGAAAVAIVGASSGWLHFMRVEDLARSAARIPAANSPLGAAGRRDGTGVHVAAATRAVDHEITDDWLRTRLSSAAKAGTAYRDQVYQELLQNYPQQREKLQAIVEAARAATAVATDPGASNSSGSASASIRALVPAWPATDCVTAMHTARPGQWLIENECDRAVAVVFASCRFSPAECFGDARVARGWSYEPNGVLMTSATDRPLRQRLHDRGPLVAPVYAARSSDDSPRRIRYLACYVTALALLALLEDPAAVDGAIEQGRWTAALRSDDCYARVLDWSSRGQRQGKSPDALLLEELDEGSRAALPAATSMVYAARHARSR